MQVGMTKDQGLYNKSSAAVHPRALAAGTLPQYNTLSPFQTFVGVSQVVSYVFPIHKVVRLSGISVVTLINLSGDRFLNGKID